MDNNYRRSYRVLDCDGGAVDVEGAEARRLFGRLFRLLRVRRLR
jgi:hypothetical protein